MFCKNCGKDISDSARVCPNCGEVFEKESIGDRVADVALRGVSIGLLALALGFFFTMTVGGIISLLTAIQGPQPGFKVDLEELRAFGALRTMFGVFFSTIISLGILALARRKKPET